MDLLFQVNHQRLFRYDANAVVAGSDNYIHAKFRFSDDWEGINVSAMFSNSGIAETVVLTERQCEVPPTVLIPGTLKVTVFGGDFITTNCAEISVEETGFDPIQLPSPPDSGTYQQILDIACEAKETARSAYNYRIVETVAERDALDPVEGLMCYVKGAAPTPAAGPAESPAVESRGLYLYSGQGWVTIYHLEGM